MDGKWMKCTRISEQNARITFTYPDIRVNVYDIYEIRPRRGTLTYTRLFVKFV